MASLYVAKKKNSWRIIEESYNSGKRSQKTVDKTAYQALGINPEWDVDRARQYVKSLNLQNNLKREDTRKVIAITRRLDRMNSVDSVYLDKVLTKGFEDKLRESNFGSERHLEKLFSHWRFIQDLVKSLECNPIDFSDNKDRIYKYFINKKISPDYSKKLLRVLNMWGYYVCKNQRLPYEPVPKPRGQIKEKIEDSYNNSKTYIGESDPLTPEMLESCNLREDLKNWLYISVWFGLRPYEIDSLKSKKKTWKVLKQDDKDVLWVYQSKLTGISEDRRWKLIPLLYPEQYTALNIIKSGIFKRPLVKSLTFPGHITTYGGRKGFTDLMLSKGQSFFNISTWLGHQSEETTRRKYKNRKITGWAG